MKDILKFEYLLNNKIGAILYNIVHSAIGPALLIAAYVILNNNTFLFIGLLWFFHITIDRTLGYGLKHFESFYHTHLGKIGPSAK